MFVAQVPDHDEFKPLVIIRKITHHTTHPIRPHPQKHSGRVARSAVDVPPTGSYLSMGCNSPPCGTDTFNPSQRVEHPVQAYEVAYSFRGGIPYVEAFPRSNVPSSVEPIETLWDPEPRHVRGRTQALLIQVRNDFANQFPYPANRWSSYYRRVRPTVRYHPDAIFPLTQYVPPINNTCTEGLHESCDGRLWNGNPCFCSCHEALSITLRCVGCGELFTVNKRGLTASCPECEKYTKHFPVVVEE